MKAILIDDERLSILLLKRMLAPYEQIVIVNDFTNPEEALAQITVNPPDVVFLDIQMPVLSGLDLAARIKEIDENIQIVFITAYGHYALDAFKVNAIHYLLKPITKEELRVTVNRLASHHELLKQKRDGSRDSDQIAVLGSMRVCGKDGQTLVKWPTRKVQELFAWFICHRDTEVDKWQLCDLLWPDYPPEKAEHSLHSTISRLRSCLKDAGIGDILTCIKGRYRCDFEGFTCDLWEFEEFVAANPVATRENYNRFERIIELYAGDLLGMEDFTWASQTRAWLQQQYVRTLHELASYYIQERLYVRADLLLRQCMEKFPYDEKTVVMLMEVHAETNSKLELIRTYDRYDQALLAEFGIPPAQTVQEHYEKLLSGI